MSETKEKLLEAKVLELEAKIKNLKNKKKYGLVWEDKPEGVVELCKTNIPVLKEIKSKEIINDEDKPVNILIEGDNYHSLSVLNYTHRGKIDAIYVDPPYNTGAKDWKYNNDYVDFEDSFRHSKWIAFMERRLRLAKDLLKETGIICVTIDDYELPTLWLLMNEVFGEDNKIGSISVEHNPQGRTFSRFLSTTNEYYLYYAKNINLCKVNNLSISEEDLELYNHKDDVSIYKRIPLQKSGFASRRTDRPTQFYPIYVNEKTLELSLDANKGWKKIIPINTAGEECVWRISLENCRKFIKDNDIEVVKNNAGKYTLYKKHRLDIGKKSTTIWNSKKYVASIYGASLLADILGKRNLFQFPKSIFAVRDSIQLMTSNKKALILDFFAGSGTTGHAVLELNKDGGSRQFILCTNNENKISEEITYPRLRNVIKGYKKLNNEKVEGLGGNLKYYKTTLIPKSYNRDEMKIRLTEECTEMLCIREGVYGEIKNKSAYKIFQQGDKIMAVYYFLSQKELVNLKKDLDKMSGQKILYCFTLDPLGLNEKDFDDWRDVRLEPIPQKILDIYQEINEY